MIVLPLALIDRNDLSLLERALIPLIARHTQQWGDKPSDIDASTLAQYLHHSPREVIAALDSMVKKSILKTLRRKTPQGVMIYYTFAPIDRNMSIQSPLTPTEYSDSNYYLNLSNEVYEELHAFALELCDREGISRDVFDDFNLYQRSQNRRSFDWCAEFERWVRRETSTQTSLTTKDQPISDTKPDNETFEMAQYFIHRLKLIDPQFEEPFDVRSWAKQIQLLLETNGYSLLDIKAVIDWLFSAKGDWFRPNVPDAYHLRKHFKRLISYTRSYRDGQPKLPDGMNIFDIIGRE